MLYYFMFHALLSTTYMNPLVIKANPLYIFKQIPHVSICFRYAVHTTVQNIHDNFIVKHY